MNYARDLTNEFNSSYADYEHYNSAIIRLLLPPQSFLIIEQRPFVHTKELSSTSMLPIALFVALISILHRCCKELLAKPTRKGE